MRVRREGSPPAPHGTPGFQGLECSNQERASTAHLLSCSSQDSFCSKTLLPVKSRSTPRRRTHGPRATGRPVVLGLTCFRASAGTPGNGCSVPGAGPGPQEMKTGPDGPGSESGHTRRRRTTCSGVAPIFQVAGICYKNLPDWGPLGDAAV